MAKDQQSKAEEEEECSWCKFMKAGPCRKVFEGWQSCVDGVKDVMEKEGNQAVAEQCAAVTAPLFECMAKHRFYYGSQLDGMASRSKEREQDTPAGAEHEQQTVSSVQQQQQQQQHAAAPGEGRTAQSSPGSSSSSSSSRACGSKSTGEAAQPGGDMGAAGAAGLAAL